MGGSAGHLVDDYLEAEALWEVEYLLAVDPVMAMAELPLLVVAPGEELSVALFDDVLVRRGLPVVVALKVHT